MPIQRLNYTRRRKLTSKEVQISVCRDEDGNRLFHAYLDLPQTLPLNAKVFVEAYRTSPATSMRFDFGTVGCLDHPRPERRRLSAFDKINRTPLFRVKVTDVGESHGKILAHAYKIRPCDLDEQDTSRSGILNTQWCDLDGPVWQLELDPVQDPLLLIDCTADPGRELGTDPRFCGLVYPEVLRRALRYALVENPEVAWDEESWGPTWLSFAFSMPGMSLEKLERGASTEDRREWIELAVKKFCQWHELSKKLGAAQQEVQR